LGVNLTGDRPSHPTAFTRPEYNSVGTGLTFDTSGNQTSLTAGVLNGTLPARVMAFSARIQF
jgi:hypothetical protein